MRNQKGEVVTGVMVVMMVVMMFFGMSFMHGGHGDRHDHGNNEQKHEHAGMGPKHMNHDHGDTENSTKSETEVTK